MNITRRNALRGGTAVALSTAAGVVVAAATPDDGEIYRLIEERGHQFKLERAADGRWREAVEALMPADFQWGPVQTSAKDMEEYFKVCRRPEIEALFDETHRREEAWLGLENRLAETPANTLKGIHAKLQAANRWEGYRFNNDLTRSATDDLARLVREG